MQGQCAEEIEKATGRAAASGTGTTPAKAGKSPPEKPSEHRDVGDGYIPDSGGEPVVPVSVGDVRAAHRLLREVTGLDEMARRDPEFAGWSDACFARLARRLTKPNGKLAQENARHCAVLAALHDEEELVAFDRQACETVRWAAMFAHLSASPKARARVWESKAALDAKCRELMARLDSERREQQDQPALFRLDERRRAGPGIRRPGRPPRRPPPKAKQMAFPF